MKYVVFLLISSDDGEKGLGNDLIQWFLEWGKTTVFHGWSDLWSKVTESETAFQDLLFSSSSLVEKIM